MMGAPLSLPTAVVNSLIPMTSTGLQPSDDARPKRLQAQLKSSRLYRSIKGSRWYWRVKLFLKRLSGRELWLRRDTTIPTRESDQWLYAPDAVPADAIVYCFGVGDSIDFEAALLDEHSVTVHAFDPTPTTLNWIESQHTPAGFEFHALAVAGKDSTLTLYPRVRRRGRRSETMWTAVSDRIEPNSGIEVPAFTVPSIMRELGHSHVDLVKLDVEGAEYDVIDAMLVHANLPTQLLVEFHHRFEQIGKERTRQYIIKLNNAGYDLFGISRTGRELSFIRNRTESTPTAKPPE